MHRNRITAQRWEMLRRFLSKEKVQKGELKWAIYRHGYGRFLLVPARTWIDYVWAMQLEKRSESIGSGPAQPLD